MRGRQKGAQIGDSAVFWRGVAEKGGSIFNALILATFAFFARENQPPRNL